MALAWFVVPYKRRDIEPGRPGRYCAMDDFTVTIHADAGAWTETEVLGNVALVKVRASATILATIASTTGFYRVTNHWLLSDSLADLTTTQRNAIQTRLLAMGYTQAEINAVMGSTLALWRQMAFGVLLNLIATRRLKPRYDTSTDTIICDGPIQPVRSIVSVDSEIP